MEEDDRWFSALEGRLRKKSPQFGQKEELRNKKICDEDYFSCSGYFDLMQIIFMLGVGKMI